MRFRTLIVFLVISATAVSAELLPHYPSTYQFGIGYVYTENTSSGTALEHWDPGDSVAISGTVEAYPLPRRFHLELKLSSGKDLYLDTGYAWKDVLLTRFIALKGVHNVETPSLASQNPDASHIYHEQTLKNFYGHEHGLYDLNLRLKAPGYAFHLFGRYLGYYQEGTFDQRYLIGYFTTTMDVYSVERKTKRTTETYTTGINGHLGPVEAEYTYTYKTFTPSAEVVLKDYYPNILSRTAGTYSHNLQPELTSSGHTFRLHTTYTGRIVGTATFTSIKQENTFSDVTRDILYMSTGIRYLPLHWLTFTLQGIYQKTTEDTPSTVTVSRYTYNVRHAPETEISILKAKARIRPAKRVVLLLGYKIKNKNLSTTTDWPLLKEDGQYQQWTLKILSPIYNALQVRLRYTHDDNEPVYNSEPNRADSVYVFGETLLQGPINPVFYYHWKNAKRDNLSYYNGVSQSQIDVTGARRGTYHQAGVIVPLTIKNVTISPSVSYSKHQIKGPLVFLDYSRRVDIIYDSQKYKEEALTYGVTCQASLNDLLSSFISFYYTIGQGKAELAQGVSNMEDFLRHSYRITELQAEVSLKTLKGIEIKPSFKYIHFDDKTELLTGGDTYQAMLLLSASF